MRDCDGGDVAFEIARVGTAGESYETTVLGFLLGSPGVVGGETEGRRLGVGEGDGYVLVADWSSAGGRDGRGGGGGFVATG